MALKFTPKSEKDVSKGFSNLAPGKYPFTVLESSIVASKSAKNPGREMVAVKLNVHGPSFDKHVYDYFADWFSEWKLKHFCETTGRAKDYAAGTVDPSQNAWHDFQGFVKIGVEEDRKNGGERNMVVDYMPDDRQKVELLTAPSRETATATPPTNSPEEDDVPF